MTKTKPRPRMTGEPVTPPPITLRSDRQRDTWREYADGLDTIKAMAEARAEFRPAEPDAWLDAQAALSDWLDAALAALCKRGEVGALLALDLALTAAGQPDPARLAWLLRWAEFDGDDLVTRQQVAEVTGASMVTVQRWATSTDAPTAQGRALAGGLQYRAADWAAWTPPATGRPGGRS